MPTETKHSSAGAHARSEASAQRRRKTKRALKAWRAVGILLIFAVIILGGLLYLAKLGMLFTPENQTSAALSSQTTNSYKGADHSFTLRFFRYNDEPVTETVKYGSDFVLPDGPEIAGYTFIGWADRDGVIEKQSSVTVFSDMDFSAKYAIAFRNEASGTHEPYMPTDEGGRFYPNEGLKRGDAVQIVYSLLDTDVVGSGKFADVEKSDEFYKAAATLKDLGALNGSRLHPDENITYGEFFQLLSNFFPASRESFEFNNTAAGDEYYPFFCLAQERGWLDVTAVSPNAELRRSEAAHIFNRLLGRVGAIHNDLSAVGTIIDVSLRDEYFSDIAEAAIPHTCTVSDGSEEWTSSSPLELKSDGFFFIGTELHRTDKYGSALVNESDGTFAYGPDGAMTSGNEELDALVQEKLQELIDPAEMSRLEMLKTLYNYVTYKCTYLRANYYEIGETGWETDEAIRMLESGKGNCYSFAGAFWALGRAIGYDVVCYSGTIGINFGPHGWTEIEIDGTTYIFDPALENEEHFAMHRFTDLYMKTYESVAGWTYKRTA